MKTEHATYNGDVGHIVGEVFICPRFAKTGSSVVRWVATDAVYDSTSNTTRVEFDGEEI